VDEQVSGTVIDEVCRNVERLIARARQTPRRVIVRAGDVAVEMEWPEGQVLVPGAPSAKAEPAGDDDGYRLCAQIIGTFYRSPEPGAKPFVSEGDAVRTGQQVAILEAMKMMTPVHADRAGRVEKILAVDGEAVEFGAPLMILSALGSA